MLEILLQRLVLHELILDPAGQIVGKNLLPVQVHLQ